MHSTLALTTVTVSARTTRRGAKGERTRPRTANATQRDVPPVFNAIARRGRWFCHGQALFHSDTDTARRKRSSSPLPSTSTIADITPTVDSGQSTCQCQQGRARTMAYCHTAVLPYRRIGDSIQWHIDALRLYGRKGERRAYGVWRMAHGVWHIPDTRYNTVVRPSTCIANPGEPSTRNVNRCFFGTRDQNAVSRWAMGDGQVCHAPWLSLTGR